MSSSPHLSHRLSQQIPSKLEEHSPHILVKWCGNALSHFFFLFRTEAFLLTTPRRWPYMSASVCGPTHPCSVCCLWAPDDTRRQERTTPPTPAWRPSSQMSSAAPQTLRVSSVIIHRMMCGGKKSKYMLLLFAGFCFHLSCAVFLWVRFIPSFWSAAPCFTCVLISCSSARSYLCSLLQGQSVCVGDYINWSCCSESTISVDSLSEGGGCVWLLKNFSFCFASLRLGSLCGSSFVLLKSVGGCFYIYLSSNKKSVPSSIQRCTPCWTPSCHPIPTSASTPTWVKTSRWTKVAWRSWTFSRAKGSTTWSATRPSWRKQPAS